MAYYNERVLKSDSNKLVDMFVGDRVVKTDYCYFGHNGDSSGILPGAKGTIMQIDVAKHPAFTCYIVKFDEYPMTINKCYRSSIKLI